jgi:hypothetical protein
MNPSEFVMDTNMIDEGDKRLFVVFHRGFELNEAKSTEAGRPVHDDVDLITIRVPGQRDTMVARADYGYQQRFPTQWAQYKANAEQISSGTRLSEVTWLTPALVADLKAANVHTVEQLAGMSDSHGHVFMGFQGLKQRAQAYLEAAAGAAPALKLQAELEKRDAEIAELRSLLERVAEQQKAATNAKKQSKALDLA